MPKKCKVCGEKCIPKQSSLEPVCGKYECKHTFAMAYVEKQREKQKKALQRERFVEKKELKEKLKTLSDWSKELQKEVNTIVRLIDKGHNCISSNKPLNSKSDSGHLYSVGSNPQIRYHLFNIFSQSVHDNQYKSGNQLEYVENLALVFDTHVQQYCISLKRLPSLKLSIDEIKEKIPIARGIIKWLRLQERKFDIQERIALRIKFNNKLGIYPPIELKDIYGTQQ